MDSGLLMPLMCGIVFIDKNSRFQYIRKYTGFASAGILSMLLLGFTSPRQSQR
jgi:hypothetical protein